MARFYTNGDTIPFTCTEAVKKGDFVKLDGMVGVAEADGAVDDVIAVSVEGVFRVDGVEDEIAVGAPLYLSAKKAVTTTAEDGTLIGRAWAAKSSGAGIALVKLNDGVAGGGTAGPAGSPGKDAPTITGCTINIDEGGKTVSGQLTLSEGGPITISGTFASAET